MQPITHLILPMDNFRSVWCLFALTAIVVFSCKKPSNDNPPTDQLIGFDHIEVENYHIPGLSVYKHHQPLLIDSLLYFILNEPDNRKLDLAVYDLEGNMQDRRTFFISDYPIGIQSANYDSDRDMIYIPAEIGNESPSGYSNPLFLVIDRNATLIKVKEYCWPGRDNGFSKVLMRPGNTPVLLAWDRAGSMGNYALYDEILIFMDENYDSLVGIKMLLDSCQYNYMAFKEEDIIHMVGTKMDSANFTSYSHYFYAEMNLSGEFPDNHRLDGLNSGHVHIRPSDPMTFYSWIPDGNRTINWRKYAEDGSMLHSTDYHLFQVLYPYYDYALTFSWDSYNGRNILYGYFYTGGGPQRPKSHGIFMIKCDDDGNDEYRVVFNEDFSGFMTSGIKLISLGPDDFLLLYGFIFDEEGEKYCITRIKL